MSIKSLIKKVVGGIVAGTMILTVASVSSAADIYCYTATITRLGNNPSYATPGATTSMYARFTCADTLIDSANRVWTANTQEKEFVLSESVGEAGYATLLTAFTLDKKVRIRVPDVRWDSTLTLVDFIN